MEENLKQEALLRQLLSGRGNTVDDDFVYSFLLGSRLFLSPHQLLTELHRLATEDVSRHSQVPVAGNMCSKCRQMHLKNDEATTSAQRNELSKATPDRIESALWKSGATNAPASAQKGTDFRSKKFVSSAFITVSTSSNAAAEEIVEGEETIRRRRRGRRRNQTDAPEASTAQPHSPALDRVLAADRSSTVSRDSGILSAVLDWEELDSANNNSHRKNTTADKASDNCDDSGFILDDDTTDTCSYCNGTPQGDNKSRHKKRQLVHVLHEWVRHFPADFRNKKIMWTLNDVIKGCQSENEELKGLCTEVVDCISRRTAAQENYEQQLSDSDLEDSLQKAEKCRKTRDRAMNIVLNLKDAADVNELAQQLCLIEMDLLRHVGAEEFLQLFTADGDEDVRTNLGACVRWFNRLSHLVGTTICMCRKRKHGRHVITLFARVANRCFELSNFNSAMAILTGLSLGPVTRLKRTWNKLVLSELHKLQNVFDPSNNFMKYRTIYMSRVGKLHSSSSPVETKANYDVANRYSIISQHSIASVTSTSSQHGDSGIECDHETSPDGTTSSSAPGYEKVPRKHFIFDPKSPLHDGVMAPFLVLLVKDVYFLNHAITTVNENGNINFEKLRKLSNILRPLEEWKLMTSSYHKHDDLQNFLLHSPVQDDADLYLLSYKREAPTNRFEKQQLKSLRAERDLKKRNESSMSKSLRRKIA